MQSLQLQQISLAEATNKRAATAMKAMGLRPGYIQNVHQCSHPHQDYIIVVCYDYLSTVMALRHLDPNGKHSFMRIDNTMLGKIPTVVMESFLTHSVKFQTLVFVRPRIISVTIRIP